MIIRGGAQDNRIEGAYFGLDLSDIENNIAQEDFYLLLENLLDPGNARVTRIEGGVVEKEGPTVIRFRSDCGNQYFEIVIGNDLESCSRVERSLLRRVQSLLPVYLEGSSN